MNPSTESLEKRIGQVSMLGQAICVAMENELHKIGFIHPETLIGRFDSVEFQISRDPSNGEEALKGAWRTAQGRSVGMVIFYADGTFYAEHDVVRPHPTSRRWFVEVVTAWGRGAHVKAEARLLPALN
jgi:hypothetical protein